ncbi:mRNA-decapping enzyme 1A [Macrosteles quadrilineatus]|uniref:mRNA-decapping enzyme 1A n=1 Tax=Macrosteles quadrilineatus TaxID=74068 RepID=UPI0023E2A2B3|nr:mRNA-decapping enzyme 1A [Macrosteles quadrilineatus]
MMAELNEYKMNFAALKRVDPYAKGLVETAAHVALYTFENEWEKTDIEGALFVYSRTGEPFHNILIMNRLNMKNLVEPVTEGLDLQLQDPFLLYRNSQKKIYGIWFYDRDECIKIAGVLSKIIQETLESKPGKVGRQPASGSGSNVDIFSMLTKAQEEFNSKSPRKTNADFLGNSHDMNFNPKETDLTPKSVMDFFAKASNGSKFAQDTNINQPPVVFINNSRSGPPPGLSRMPSLPIAIPPPQNDVKPLLQRLMSNPVHSVEHIEKQQRAITPQQGDFAGFLKNGGNHMIPTSNSIEIRNNFSFTTKQGLPIIENGPVNIPGINKVENSLGFLRISDSPPSVVHSQQFFNSKLTQNSSPVVTEGLTESTSILTENRPLSAPMDLKPALMPPVMFTSSAKKEGSVEAITPASSKIGNSAQANPQNIPEPLTKKQFVQAFSYLMKNDQEFTNKLHEAYLKSFAELLS